MIFFPTDIESKLDKFLYVQAIWNAGAGKTGQIKQIIGELFAGAAFLKIFGLEKYMWLLVPVGIIYMITIFLFGFFLVRKHIIIREGGMMNRISNPQIEEILKILKGKNERNPKNS